MGKPNSGYWLNALPNMGFRFDVDVIVERFEAENCGPARSEYG
ncbi:hypothetical protein [Chromobacterium vaccinii]|nr:hypothetical protein [Chromobacterium vaccinii]